MISFSKLQLFRRCPRLLFFYQTGYCSPIRPEPILAGTIAHKLVATSFRGKEIRRSLAEIQDEIYKSNIAPLDNVSKYLEIEKLARAGLRAMALATRYIASYANKYTVLEVEHELVWNGIKGIADLVVMLSNGQGSRGGQAIRAIVEFKTSRMPDIRYFDLSYQADLYAVLWHKSHAAPTDSTAPVSPTSIISRVIYDVICDDGFQRYERPPRCDRGESMIAELRILEGMSEEYLFEKAWITWECPKCEYFNPCYLAETSGLESCMEYMGKRYIKERRDETIRDKEE